MGSDPLYVKWPLLPLAQHVFTVTNAYATKPTQQAAVTALQDAIAEDKMAPFYRYLAHPMDGILNSLGEGTAASAPAKHTSRKSSLVGMVASRTTTSGVNLPWDEALYNKLKEDNDQELAQIQKEEDEAVEQAGDTEVMAAKGKRAEFWARVGDKVWHPFPLPPTYPVLSRTLTQYAMHRTKPLQLMKLRPREPASWVPRSTSYWP